MEKEQVLLRRQVQELNSGPETNAAAIEEARVHAHAQMQLELEPENQPGQECYRKGKFSALPATPENVGRDEWRQQKCLACLEKFDRGDVIGSLVSVLYCNIMLKAKSP